MKKIKNWVLAATLTVCSAMMLTSCTDVIGQADNPVQPVDPVDPAAELAQETFVNEPVRCQAGRQALRRSRGQSEDMVMAPHLKC